MPDNQEPPPSRRRLSIPPNFKGIFLRHPDKLAPSVPQPTLLNGDIFKHHQPHDNPSDLSPPPPPPPSSSTHSPESTPSPRTLSQKSAPRNNTTQSGRARRKFEASQASKRVSTIVVIVDAPLTLERLLPNSSRPDLSQNLANPRPVLNRDTYLRHR